MNPEGVCTKEINGEDVTLALTMAYPEGNAIGELFGEIFVPALAEAGIQLTLLPMPMSDLLASYYNRADRDVDMYYLASNFDLVFDPSVNFIPDENGEPNWSYTKQKDSELYRLAVSMRETEPGDYLTYVQRWVAFQERFSKVLPMIPVYSNEYFDLYTPALQNYNIARHTTWGNAVVPAYLNQ